MAAPPPDGNNLRIVQESYLGHAWRRNDDTREVGDASEEIISKSLWEGQFDAKLQETMKSTIRELQEKNDKLSQEMVRLKRLNEEMELSTVEVFEENIEEKRRNKELSSALMEKEDEVQKAEHKNSELQAEIEQMKRRIMEQDELLYASLAVLNRERALETVNPVAACTSELIPLPTKKSSRERPREPKAPDMSCIASTSVGVGDSGEVLNFIKGEQVPRYTHIYQLENGTIVYHRYNPKLPHKLYVKWQGKKVKAEIPDGLEIKLTSAVQAYGNAIYVSDGAEIFKAVFTPPDSFLFYFVREHLQGETVGRAGCSRNRGGKTYSYRMCDDPEKDGILVEYSGDGPMIGIFKRNVFYIEHDASSVRPTIQQRGSNAYAIVTSEKHWSQLVSNDLSSLIYYTEGSRSRLFTFDNQFMEFLAPLKCGRNLGSIVGVHNGWITAHYGSDDNVSFLLHAQLPTGHFTISQPTGGEMHAADSCNSIEKEEAGFETHIRLPALATTTDSMQKARERDEESSKQQQLQSASDNLLEANWELKVSNNKLTNELEEVKRKYRKLLMMSGREVK